MKKSYFILLFCLTMLLGGCNTEIETADEVFVNDLGMVEGVSIEPEPPILGNGIEEKTDFTYEEANGYFGWITLEGYLTTETVPCAFVEDDICEIERALFKFEKSDNTVFEDFEVVNQGNSFIGEGWLSLGCYLEDKGYIFYENAGDEGFVQGQIGANDFSALLASSSEAPVMLEMQKPILTLGSGAPDCYSHFRNFGVID